MKISSKCPHKLYHDIFNINNHEELVTEIFLTPSLSYSLTSDKIPLTLRELATLSDFVQQGKHDLDIYKDFDADSWGKEKAIIVEQRLAPSGLVDKVKDSLSLYTLSPKSVTGRYHAVILSDIAVSNF